MSAPMNIYVFSNGNAVWHTFEALATFVNSAGMDGFGGAFGIAGVFSVAGAVLMYLRSHDLTAFLKWVAIYFVVSSILLGTHVDIAVNDESNAHFAPMRVDNVPLGVAFPAWLFSHMEMGLTKGFEMIFHTPGNLDYSKTGMLYGATLYHTMNQAAEIQSTQLHKEMNQFVSQCIVPDVLINHKYTFGQLKNAPDIFSFLEGYSMSPLRGIQMSSGFTTCAAAITPLQTAVEGEVNSQASLIGTMLFGKNAPQPAAMLSHMQNSYQYMLNMSGDAQSLLVQNTMTNALRSGLNAWSAKNNATEIINLGYTKAMQGQLVRDNVMQRFGSYMIPMSQTMFFMLLVALFPLIMLLALQPAMFVNQVKHYVNAFMVISTWPLMYTVINYFMTTTLSDHMIGLFGQGLTLSNQNPLIYQAQMFAANAGYYLSAIPVLSVFIFKGLDSAMMYGSQTLFGNMQQSVGNAAAGLGSGDINLGNTSIGNHSWNNLSANKWDTNSSIMSGMSTMQQPNGASITHALDGQNIYNTQGAMSNLATSVNIGHTLSSSLNQQAGQAADSALSARTSFDQSLSNAANHAYNWGQTNAANESYGSGASMGTATSNAQALSNMHSLAQDLSKSTGISMQESYGDLTKLAGNAGASIKTDKSLEGKLLGLFTGVSGHVGVNGEYAAQSSNTDNSSNSESRSAFDKIVNDYRSNLDYIQNSNRNTHAESGHNETDSVAHSISADLRQSDSFAKQYSADETERDSYSQMANYAEQNSDAINSNYGQAFADFVQQQSPENASEILSNTNDPAVLADQEKLSQAFVQQNAASMESVLKEQLAKANPEDFYAQNKELLNDKGWSVDEDYFKQKDSVIDDGKADVFNDGVFKRIQGDVSATQGHAAGAIHSGANAQNSAWQHNQEQTTHGLTQGQHSANRSAFLAPVEGTYDFLTGQDGGQSTNFIEHNGSFISTIKPGGKS